MRQEFELLKAFNGKVDRLMHTNFAKRFENEMPEVFICFEELKISNLGDGQVNLFGKIKSWVPGFDEDEIDAFVLTYRMIMQKNDRLSVASIAEIYERDWMPIEAASSFREAREYLNNYLDSVATLELDQQLAIRDIIDVVIYGGLAHSNRQKAEVFNAWSSNQAIAGLMWVEFMAAMKKALAVFSFIRRLNDAVIEASSGEDAQISHPTRPKAEQEPEADPWGALRILAG